MGNDYKCSGRAKCSQGGEHDVYGSGPTHDKAHRRLRQAAESACFDLGQSLRRIDDYHCEYDPPPPKVYLSLFFAYTKQGWLNAHGRDAESLRNHRNWAKSQSKSRVQKELGKIVKEVRTRVTRMPSYDLWNCHGWMKQAFNYSEEEREHGAKYVEVTKKWLRKHGKDDDFVRTELRFYLNRISNAIRSSRWDGL